MRTNQSSIFSKTLRIMELTILICFGVAFSHNSEKASISSISGSDSISANRYGCISARAYTATDKMAAAETFLNGGTNFETPMREALRLMEQEGFENADVVFITDGECALPDAFREELLKEQVKRRFTVTGVLLDSGEPGMDFSLNAFCQNIYRTSELVGDEIVRELVSGRI